MTETKRLIVEHLAALHASRTAPTSATTKRAQRAEDALRVAVGEDRLSSTMRAESAPASYPFWVLGVAIGAVLAIIAIHAWSAVMFARSQARIDATAMTVAMIDAGVAWTAWAVTMIWIARRRS